MSAEPKGGAESGADPARDRLVRDNLGLVYDLARQLERQAGLGPERSDLVSAGVIGLIQAAHAFEVERGFAFSTMAVTRIRGAMLDEMRRWDEAPRSVRKKEREIRRSEDDLRVQLEREPTSAELAEHLALTPDELQAWTRDVSRCFKQSLDDVVSDGEGAGRDLRVGDVVPDEDAPNIIEALGRDQAIAVLGEKLLELPERERRVLALYYIEGLKLREIAEIFGVTESRISQVRHAALRLLRSMLTTSGVEEA